MIIVNRYNIKTLRILQVELVNLTDEQIRYNRMKRYVMANITSYIQILDSNPEEVDTKTKELSAGFSEY